MNNCITYKELVSILRDNDLPNVIDFVGDAADAIEELLASIEQMKCDTGDSCTDDPDPSCVKQHKSICDELNQLYRKKNSDYGDSFHATFIEEGIPMCRIRLSDKLNRFKRLTKSTKGQQINDESIRDTLIDLANYAIMTVMELDEMEV